MKKGMAITGLVLGIVGVVISVCAVVFGAIGMKKGAKCGKQ